MKLLEPDYLKRVQKITNQLINLDKHIQDIKSYQKCQEVCPTHLKLSMPAKTSVVLTYDSGDVNLDAVFDAILWALQVQYISKNEEFEKIMEEAHEGE